MQGERCIGSPRVLEASSAERQGGDSVHMGRRADTGVVWVEV